MVSQNFRTGTWALVMFSLGTSILAPPLARSQNADQSQNRAELLRSQPNPTYGPGAPSGEEEGYAVASPNDKDLGEQQILKRQEEYLPFTISASTPVFYTSNVALVRDGEEDDVLFSPGISVTYQPRLTKTLYAEIGVAQQFFLYDRFSELDFASFDAIAASLIICRNFTTSPYARDTTIIASPTPMTSTSSSSITPTF